MEFRRRKAASLGVSPLKSPLVVDGVCSERLSEIPQSFFFNECFMCELSLLNYNHISVITPYFIILFKFY